MTTPEKVLQDAQKKNVKVVDLKFVDLAGTWQHLRIKREILTEELFKEGVAFDGSSIRGFQRIDKSNMLMIPEADTAFIDPFMTDKTLRIIGRMADPTRKE